MPTRIIDYSAIAESYNPGDPEVEYEFSNGRKFYSFEKYSPTAPVVSVTGLPFRLTYYIGLPDWG